MDINDWRIISRDRWHVSVLSPDGSWLATYSPEAWRALVALHGQPTRETEPPTEDAGKNEAEWP